MSTISYYGDYQVRALDYLIKLLQNDSYLSTVTGMNVYPSHLSNITNPLYPCITFHTTWSGDPTVQQMSTCSILLDVWSKVNASELWRIYASRDPFTNRPSGVRNLLVGQRLCYTEVSLDKIYEEAVNDDLFDPKGQTYHLQAKLWIAVSGRTVVIT